MSWQSVINRSSYRIGAISDSSMIGKVEGTLAFPLVPIALRVLEALGKDTARGPLNSPNRPDFKFVGSSGLASSDQYFHESQSGHHNCLSGSTAEDFINGTNGATTLSALYTAIGTAFPLTHLIIELGGNDIGVLGRSPATACASVATLVSSSKSLSPSTKVVVFPPHRVLVTGGDLDALTALELDPVNTGADITVTGVSGYTTGMMVSSGSDPHPKVHTNWDLAGTWRGTLDPVNYGGDAMGMWLWDAIFPEYARPLKAGEVWAP